MSILLCNYATVFNTGEFGAILLNDEMNIYYSVVTEKELLTKPGLSDSEMKAVPSALLRYKRVKLDAITIRYSHLRKLYPQLMKEDALIAATALVKNMPLLTRNKRHLRFIVNLVLFG